jgi:hypothetical protein
MFAHSVEEMVPRTKQNISARKTMITIFFTSARLLVLNFLSTETKFNQDYFIDAVLPELHSEKTPIVRLKDTPNFSVYMDNSICHNGIKVTEKHVKKQIARVSYPSYSPYFSPCDFWLFEMLKKAMKGRVFQSEQYILADITRR